jgi:hypothetical protein
MSASAPASTAALPGLPHRPRPPRRLRWPWLLLAGLLGLVGLLAAALWLAVERTPRLPAASTPVSGADLDRVRALLERNDPRRAQPGTTRAALLSQRDLELLLQQAGKRLAGGARGRVRLQPGVALVEASVPLPAHPASALFGGWLNLHAVLRQTRDLPAVERLRLGRLPVPGWLAEAALPPLLRALNLDTQGALAQRLVRHVAFGPQTLVLAYAWPDNPQQAFAESFLPSADQARLRRHAEHLAGLMAQLTRQGSQPVALGLVLQHMFAQAATHSVDAPSAALENRAALVALGFLAAGQPLAPLLGMPPPDGRPQRPPPLRLQGRPDWPLHLLISAALAAESGSPLADAIGLYKEVADARHGSGFSFGDLAADRAGARLGLAARRDPLRLQTALAAGQPDSALLPPVHDLPENMPEAEFHRRFGGVGTPAYQAVVRDIEARLDRLPLLAAAR